MHPSTETALDRAFEVLPGIFVCAWSTCMCVRAALRACARVKHTTEGEAWGVPVTLGSSACLHSLQEDRPCTRLCLRLYPLLRSHPHLCLSARPDATPPNPETETPLHVIASAAAQGPLSSLSFPALMAVFLFGCCRVADVPYIAITTATICGCRCVFMRAKSAPLWSVC